MQQIEVNLAAQRARLKVIEEEIAKLTAGAAGKPQETSAQAEMKTAWDSLIAAREKAVAAARSNAGNLDGQVALANAEAELAEARIRAAQASVAARPPGFDAPDRWQGERITLRASIAEQEARLGALSERLAVLQKKSGSPATQPVTVYDIERLQRDEQRARQEVDELTNQLDQLRRERRAGGAGSAPKLLVLDGRGDTAKE
jgi:chromosome segregation ATPase